MFISPWVQCPQVQKNIGIRNVSRCHIKKSTLPHGHNFPIGGNHSPCENAHQQPQCPWGLDKSWATHGPSWSPQMIPISMLVLGYALNCRENLTFQTLGFGILVFGNNGAQCACKDNFQNEVVGCFFQEMVKKTMAFLIKYRQLCSCFPQMSLSTSFSPFQHVPQKQFRTSHGSPWSNGMAFQKTFPDSGSVSRLSTCRKELQESDAAWS